MSFPHNDPYWASTAEFLSENYKAGERVLAPELFWRIVSEVRTYPDTFFRTTPDYDWIVLHKGELDRVDRKFLEWVLNNTVPVFANEVFVIFTSASDRGFPSLLRSDHVRAFVQRVEALPHSAIASPLATSDASKACAIRSFATMTDAELRDAMNDFWRDGGYQYVTLRDKAYFAEIDSYLDDFIDDATGLTVLDLGCGKGRVIPKLDHAKQVIGVDVSDEAIRLANETRRQPNFSFRTMDAHDLSFDDASFDLVLFVDAIEHVRDAEKVLREAGRVTKPGGRLFATVSNRDSLNQIMTRKMGFPEFTTNHQHIREFDMSETRKLLADGGFSIERQGGIFLHPYWGIPGIDHQLRALIDNDAEVVELHRALGRAAGAEHAYCSVVLGRKRHN